MDDFAEPEVGIAVAVTAAVCSPKIRRTLRKGLIYSLAGLISLSDAAQEAAQGVKTAVKGRKTDPQPLDTASDGPAGTP